MRISTMPLHLRRLLLSSSALTGIALASTAQAGQPGLPTGGVVTAGSATIAQPNANQLAITTGTSRTVIDWTSFSIGNGNKVTIQQPGTSSITVNEVTGGTPSQIFGDLSSNGRVVLANPNGLWFGPDSHVDVAGLVASTATLSDAAKKAFAAGGRLSLDTAGKANASIQNDGRITIANQGLAALVAPGVRNNGVIQATLGTVQLASGTTSTLDFYGDGLVSMAVTAPVSALAIGPDGKPFQATIENNGALKAGQVLVTASVVKGVVDNAINMSGVTEAKGVTVSGGDIVLDGGDGAVTVAGTLDATSQQAKGGNIAVTGGAVTLASTSNIDVSGATGGGTVQVGGGPHGGGTLKHATSTTVASGATIKANATRQGDGGNVAVWSDGLTTFNGSIEAKGAGSGNGGWVETSGHFLSIATGMVDASAPGGTAGTWLLDPFSLDVVSGGNDNSSTNTYTSSTGGTTVFDSDINASLAFENVTLQTGGAGGNITVDSGAALNWSSSEHLTARCDRERRHRQHRHQRHDHRAQRHVDAQFDRHDQPTEPDHRQRARVAGRCVGDARLRQFDRYAGGCGLLSLPQQRNAADGRHGRIDDRPHQHRHGQHLRLDRERRHPGPGADHCDRDQRLAYALHVRRDQCRRRHCDERRPVVERRRRQGDLDRPIGHRVRRLFRPVRRLDLDRQQRVAVGLERQQLLSHCATGLWRQRDGPAHARHGRRGQRHQCGALPVRGRSLDRRHDQCGHRYDRARPL